MKLTEEEQYALDSGHDGGHAVILADVVRRALIEIRRLRARERCPDAAELARTDRF